MKRFLALMVAGMMVFGTMPALAEKSMYQVGITQIAEHPSLDNCRKGFLMGLAEEGFVEGENLTISYQNPQGDMGTAALIAENFVLEGVDLMCAIATPSAITCLNVAQSKNIPVIFTAVSDPIAAGLVISDTEAGLGATGTCDKLPIAAQLQMIRTLLPTSKAIGILYNTSEPNSITHIAQYEALAPDYGFTIVASGITAAGDIPLAMDALLPQVDCLTNLTDNMVVAALPAVLEAANAKEKPVFGSEEEQVRNGCLASVGIDYVALGVETGKMAARVLRGEDVSTIPFTSVEGGNVTINPAVGEMLGIALDAYPDAQRME